MTTTTTSTTTSTALPTASFGTVFARALRGHRTTVAGIESHEQELPVADWRRRANHSDWRVLDHCRGTTLDVGCGPGRMGAHLVERGHQALGIDIVREAVGQARERGLVAIQHSLFEPMPGEGLWDTVLLADGNIGIGGDPEALLRRCAQMLGERGRIVCDLSAPGTGLSVRDAWLTSGGLQSPTFRWARVGPEAIHALAAAAGLRRHAVREHEGRWFAVLTR